MAGNVNMAIDDELLAQATGGLTDNDPYGYVCEATVISGAGTSVIDGMSRTAYTVDADNGKKYLAKWMYPETLNLGDKVQLIHDEDGCYSLEPIMG